MKYIGENAIAELQEAGFVMVEKWTQFPSSALLAQAKTLAARGLSEYSWSNLASELDELIQDGVRRGVIRPERAPKYIFARVLASGAVVVLVR